MINQTVVAAILGSSPYMTAEDAMRKMVREHCGAEPEFEGNLASEHARYHHAGALVDLGFYLNGQLMPGNRMFRNDFAYADIHGFHGRRIVQVKCPYGIKSPYDLKDISELPADYDKVQFLLWVSRHNECLFYQWGAMTAGAQTIEADYEWRQENLPKLNAFHQDYLREIRYPVRHIEPKRKVIDTPAAQELVAKFHEVETEIRLLAGIRQAIIAQMAGMTNGHNAIIAGRNFTRIPVKEGMPDAWRLD